MADLAPVPIIVPMADGMPPMPPEWQRWFKALQDKIKALEARIATLETP